tara:strand:- start:588 stop:848 length:261 start_codon:yes stop_codon:yes gene_type:complete
MSVECPVKIFKQLEDGCGDYVDLAGDVRKFVYRVQGNGTWLGDSDMSWCEEIECEHKKLFLIYDDPEAWALGHASKIRVVKSLDDL